MTDLTEEQINLLNRLRQCPVKYAGMTVEDRTNASKLQGMGLIRFDGPHIGGMTCIITSEGVAELVTRTDRLSQLAIFTEHSSCNHHLDLCDEREVMKFSTLVVLIISIIVAAKILEMTHVTEGIDTPGLYALLFIASVLKLRQAIRDPK